MIQGIDDHHHRHHRLELIRANLPTIAMTDAGICSSYPNLQVEHIQALQPLFQSRSWLTSPN